MLSCLLGLAVKKKVYKTLIFYEIGYFIPGNARYICSAI